MDEIDIRIAEALEANPTMTLQELAELVDRTIPPVWKRIKKLEQSGFITRKVVVDWSRIGVSTTEAASQAHEGWRLRPDRYDGGGL